MPYDTRHQCEVRWFLAHLQDCFELWMDAMDLVLRTKDTPLRGQHLIVAMGSIAAARHQLAQRTVSAELTFAHRAALTLLQSAMDALSAIVQGKGKPALRDMSEQLTIFQSELCRLAESVGFITDV